MNTKDILSEQEHPPGVKFIEVKKIVNGANMPDVAIVGEITENGITNTPCEAGILGGEEKTENIPENHAKVTVTEVLTEDTIDTTCETTTTTTKIETSRPVVEREEEAQEEAQEESQEEVQEEAQEEGQEEGLREGEELPECETENTSTPNLYVESEEKNVFLADVEAPENTKLFFKNVRSFKHWNQLYGFYLRHFGPTRINPNGTKYLVSKHVGYINFYRRSDMLQAMKYAQWNPCEAFQQKEQPKVDVEPISSNYVAYATGFENWKVNVIKPVALKLLNATDIFFREQPDIPGVCTGGAVVAYDTTQDLEKALKIKNFTLKCINRTAVITLKPYEKNLSTLRKEQIISKKIKSQTKFQKKNRRRTTMEALRANTEDAGATENMTYPKKASGTRVRQRRNTIKSWIKNGIISKELGEKYLDDCKRELEELTGLKSKAKESKTNDERTFSEAEKGLLQTSSTLPVHKSTTPTVAPTPFTPYYMPYFSPPQSLWYTSPYSCNPMWAQTPTTPPPPGMISPGPAITQRGCDPTQPTHDT